MGVDSPDGSPTREGRAPNHPGEPPRTDAAPGLDDAAPGLDDAAPGLDDAKDLARGVVVNSLGMMARSSLAIFAFVAAHIYGKPALGLFFLAFGATDVASKVARFGLDRSLVYQTARHGGDCRHVLRFHVGLVIGLTLVVAGTLAAIAHPLAVYVFDTPELVLPLRLSALAIPFSVTTEILLAATRTRRVMRYEALVRGGIEPAVLIGATFLFIPLGAPNGWGAEGLVLAQVFAHAVGTAAATWALVHVLHAERSRPRDTHRLVPRRALRFAAPLAAMDTLNLLVAKIDLFLVGALLGPAAAGVYGLIAQIVSLVKSVRQAFEPIFGPIAADLTAGKDRGRLRRSFGLTTRWLMAGSLLPALVLALFAPETLGIFGMSGGDAETALAILALSHALFGTFSAAENVIVMAGHPEVNALLAIAMMIVSGATGLALLPEAGLPGAAIAMLLGHVTISAGRLLAGQRWVRVHPIGRHLVWPLVTAALTTAAIGGTLAALAPAPLPVRLAMLVLTPPLYLGLLFFGAREPEERQIRSGVRDALRRFVSRLRTPNGPRRNKALATPGANGSSDAWRAQEGSER